MELDNDIRDFVKAVASDEIDVYNEFSFQHELGIFLRNCLSNCKIEFERNIGHFGLNGQFVKKEIDITIFPRDSSDGRRSAIELKYPRNGQFPESMFSFCKDICFLEQLLMAGFHSAYFLVFVDHPRFYSGSIRGIYRHFRGGEPITGLITKPTGLKNQEVSINGSYVAEWQPLSGRRKFCLIRLDRL